MSGSATGSRALAERGFTLIELIVVMSLIILLATIGLTAYQSSVKRGREAVLQEDLYRMRDAIDQFYADKNKYPADLNELVSGNYMRRVPVDPVTQSADDVAGRAGRARSEQSLRRARHLQRHERLRRRRARRHEVFRLVGCWPN